MLRLNIDKLHYNIMGAVFRPKDVNWGYKKVIENAIKDLSPDNKYSLIPLYFPTSSPEFMVL